MKFDPDSAPMNAPFPVKAPNHGTAADPAWIGRAVRRVEDAALVAGRGRFVGDLAPPDCLHLEFFRSPYARGQITRIDIEAARAHPGVVAVLTAADLAGAGRAAVNGLIDGLKLAPFTLLAGDSVEAVGQPVVAVIATSAGAARDAAATVDIAVESAAPRGHSPDNAAFTQSWTAGACAQAFAEAAHIVRVDIDYPRLAPMALEPRGALASWDDNGLTVWLPTQAPHRARIDLANVLGMPHEQIRVIAPDVGGAFGGKASLYPEDAVVAWAARALRRPVKWSASRGDDFLAATHGRGGRTEGALAVAADGRALALSARLSFPLGHWMPYSSVVPGRNAARILPGPYRIDNVDIELTGYLTSAAGVGIYRGAGRPEACMLMERLMDRAATALGMDPLELRRRNFIAPDAFPYTTPTGQVLDSGDYPALIAKAAKQASYAELCRERTRRRKRREIVGVGSAFYIEPCGQGWESARIGLTEDGTIVLATGSSAQGQGRETAYAQIVCDVLKTPFEAVRVVHGDTQTTPNGIGALASRGTPIGGSAVLRVTRAFLGKAIGIARKLLDCPDEALEAVAAGIVWGVGDGRCASWADIAHHALANGVDVAEGLALTTTEIYDAPGEAWSSGCCVAVVSIDSDTGELKVEQVTWIDDAGVVINPMLVEGQLRGGFAQGVGAVTSERIVYDEEGQLLTASLMDYGIPRAGDIPPLVIDKLPAVSPANALGAKGVGEAGCIGPPAAIMNAAVDALSPFGVTHLDIPLTSETIWRALEAHRHSNTNTNDRRGT